jgi:hypothetical protein
VFAENAQYDLKTPVLKTMLSFTYAMLSTFGDNGDRLKLSNIWANSKNIFENVGYTVLGIY